MKAIFVDDERSAHINFHYDIKDRTEIDSLDCFFKAEEALEFAKSNTIDCAFLDIALGGDDSGIDLAAKLKEIHPHLEVIFITASDEYARDSYRVGGRSYLTKPYTPEELDEALFILQKLTVAHRSHIQDMQLPRENVSIKTFGNFDLIVNNRPVAFKNAKAKELFAFLVHQRGGSVNSAQIFLALWEHQEYTASTSTYVRRTARALKEELDLFGLGGIFINKRNCYSIDTSRFVCDYYNLMAGSSDDSYHYNGEYMNQYSWGESTIPLIDRKVSTLSGSLK